MKLPRIIIYTVVLAFFVFLYLILTTLSFYLIPSVFGAFLAMLMLPINRKLERWHIPRVLAIIISMLIILLVMVGIGSLFTTQVLSFAQDLPEIKKQLAVKLDELQHSIAEKTGLGIKSQMNYVDQVFDSMMKSTDVWATSILVATGGTLAAIALLIVHFFLFLFYRNRIKEFFMQLLPAKGQDKADEVINQIAKVSQQYLTGVVTVMGILAVLNSTGFLLLGIRNAIFFGILAAVLNVIPYVGVWIGSALPILMALITKDSFAYAVGVLLVIVITQFIDNNFLTPRITGSQVKINALATIGIIIVGGAVWGVAGMILFIPLLGMLKIVFDNVDELKPFGYLIGDDGSSGENPVKKLWHRYRKK